MLKVVEEKDWIKGDYVPIASLKIKPNQIENYFNFKFIDGYENGLGDSKWQTLELQNGSRFVFEYLENSPDKSTSILCMNNLNDIEYILKKVFNLLNVTMKDVTWIREDVKLYNSVDIMSKNAEKPRSWLMWLSIPLSYLTVYFLYLNISTRSPLFSNFQILLFLSPFILIAIGITVSTIFPRKGWRGLRVISFIVFIGYLSYFIDQFLIHPNELTVSSHSSANAFNALLGMLLIGFPSLAYTFWGSVLGRLGHKNQIKVTRGDIRAFLLLKILMYISAILLIGSFSLYVFQLIFR